MLLGSERKDIPVYYPPDHHQLSSSVVLSDEPVELCGVFFPEAAHAPMRVPASATSTPVAPPRSLFFNANDRAMTGAYQLPPSLSSRSQHFSLTRSCSCSPQSRSPTGLDGLGLTI